MTDEERDAMMIEMKTDIKWVRVLFEDHITTHRTYTTLLAGALISSVVAIVFSLM